MREDRERQLSLYDVRLIARSNENTFLFVDDGGLLKLPGGKSQPNETPDVAIIREANEEAIDATLDGELQVRDVDEYCSKQLHDHERVYHVLVERDPQTGMRTERFVNPDHLLRIGAEGEIPILVDVGEIVAAVTSLHEDDRIVLDNDGQWRVIPDRHDRFHGEHIVTVVRWLHEQATNPVA